MSNLSEADPVAYREFKKIERILFLRQIGRQYDELDLVVYKVVEGVTVYCRRESLELSWGYEVGEEEVEVFFSLRNGNRGIANLRFDSETGWTIDVSKEISLEPMSFMESDHATLNFFIDALIDVFLQEERTLH